MARNDIFDDTDFDADIDGTESVETPGDAEDSNTTPEDYNGAPASTEAPAPEPTDAEKIEADAKAAPLVNAFILAADEAADNADTSTGTVPEYLIKNAVLKYSEITGGIKYKNQAKDYVQDKMKSSLNEKAFIRAGAYSEVQTAMLAATAARKSSGSAKAKVTVSPDQAWADKFAAADLVSELVANRVPADVTDEWESLLPDDDKREVLGTEADAYIDWAEDDNEDKGDAPTTSPVALAAAKLFLGKAVGKKLGGSSTRQVEYTGPRRSVPNHIISAFAGVESGTFLSVNDITKHTSVEYGDDHPSAGAVSAALARKTKIEGVTPASNDKGKGAVQD